MAKWTEQMKNRLQNTAQVTARKSVGKSVPAFFHEPKVPACLKTKEKAED